MGWEKESRVLSPHSAVCCCEPADVSSSPPWAVQQLLAADKLHFPGCNTGTSVKEVEVREGSTLWSISTLPEATFIRFQIPECGDGKD